MSSCSLAFDETSTSKSYSTPVSAASESELESSLDHIIERYDFYFFYVKSMFFEQNIECWKHQTHKDIDRSDALKGLE